MPSASTVSEFRMIAPFGLISPLPAPNEASLGVGPAISALRAAWGSSPPVGGRRSPGVTLPPAIHHGRHPWAGSTVPLGATTEPLVGVVSSVEAAVPPLDAQAATSANRPSRVASRRRRRRIGSVIIPSRDGFDDVVEGSEERRLVVLL